MKVKIDENGGKTRNNGKMTFNTIKEMSNESIDSKDNNSEKKVLGTSDKELPSSKDSSHAKDFSKAKESSLGKDSSLLRDDLSSPKQESDLNDREDWKMSDENKFEEKASSDTNLKKNINESPGSISDKKNDTISKMVKAPLQI